MDSSTATPKKLDASSGALWASAMLIGALLTVQAGKLGAPEAATAGNLADAGQFKMLSADAGGGEEFLAVLSVADETISIYGVQNQKTLELYQVAKLPELFEQAKGAPSRR